jgi:hypothetical protein
MWERELGHGELRHPCPRPPSSFYIRTVRQGPQPLVGWRPRSWREIERGLGLGPIPLDARWGQSNKERPVYQVDAVVGRCLLASVQCRWRSLRSRPTTAVGAAWSTSDGNVCPYLEREREVGSRRMHAWWEIGRRQ